MSIFDQLSAPFANVHWRAQNMKADGTGALALAYIDARDVMDRLDSVVGPANWRDDFVETPKGRILASLEIRIDGEWIKKTDGAGDTDVEGEKGAISDALKRAAVKWGIGRYLYDLGDVWAECEPMKDRDGNLLKNAKGKPQFKKWTAKGLADLQRAIGKVAAAAPAPVVSSDTIDDAQWSTLVTMIGEAKMDVKTVCESYKIDSLKELPAARFAALKQRLDQVIQDIGKVAA
jgi:hypothetical protein